MLGFWLKAGDHEQLCECIIAAGVEDEFGVQQAPGLMLASSVSVPALSIPASNVTVMVAGSTGVVQPSITLQVKTHSPTPAAYMIVDACLDGILL